MHLRGIFAAVFVLVLPLPGLAGVMQYYGFDVKASPWQPAPNSTQAAAAFAAEAGLLRTITFEEELLGMIPGTSVLGDGTVLTSVQPTQGAIVEQVDQSDMYNWNTTPGGKNYLRLAALEHSTFGRTYFRFVFSRPIRAFGAYFTGITNELGVHYLTFDDGAAQRLFVRTQHTLHPQMSFFGFVSTGIPFTSVTFETVGTPATDFIVGMDDIRYSAVPEPSAPALLLAGVLMLAAGRVCGLVRRG